MQVENFRRVKIFRSGGFSDMQIFGEVVSCQVFLDGKFFTGVAYPPAAVKRKGEAVYQLTPCIKLRNLNAMRQGMPVDSPCHSENQFAGQSFQQVSWRVVCDFN